MQKNLALLNISKKMQAHLSENKLSILKLSQRVPDIKYQTLKRIIEFDGDGSLPNIASLMSLADYLNCSISELLSDNIVASVDNFASIEDFCLKRYAGQLKLHIPIDEYASKKLANLFTIQDNSLKLEKVATTDNIIPENVMSHIQVFSKMSAVEYDGHYIAENKNKIKIIKVVSVSSSNLMIEQNGKIVNINSSDVKIMAKFIHHGIVIANQQKLLIAYQ